MTEPAEARGAPLLPDEEIRRRMMADPETRAKVEEVLRQVKDGGASDAGLGPEELSDFLRDRAQGVDSR